MKPIKNYLVAIMAFGICSCMNENLISLKDCPHEDSSIDVQSLKSKGEIYIVDANFDGNKDIIINGKEGYELLLWNKDDNVFKKYNKSFDYPVFSPSKKIVYTLVIWDGFGRYEKHQWDDDKGDFSETGLDIMDEVFAKDFNYSEVSFINAKYNVSRMDSEAGHYVADINCYEVKGLPEEWQEVLNKMKADYPIEELYNKTNQELIKKKQEEESAKAPWNEAEAVMAYPQVCDEVWVDMGIESDDGDTLYWATSDLIMRKDNTFGLAKYGDFGSEFGWGDITGNAESTNDLNEYGGTNPPRSIVGNQKYDIVAAHLNSPIRLPSKTEWMRLLENCDNKFITIKREEVLEGDNGLPSWAQGQWMADARIPNISGGAVVALSVKIDGIVSSVIVTEGGKVLPIYEGVYDYKGSEIKMGNLTVLVDKTNKRLVTEEGYGLRKVNNDTESSKTYGLLLTSRINGNKLFFPIPSPNVAAKSGKLAIEFQSAQEKEFWSGTVYEENKVSAYTFYIKGSNPIEVALAISERFSKNSVRPVTTIPTTVSIGKTKSSSVE